MPRAKAHDTGMLQETPYDALDCNVFGKAGNTRTQATHATDDQRDRYASLRGAIQGFDHAGVDERIELGPNRRRPPGLRMGDLGLDEFNQLGPDAVRRNR